ncbi:MAG: hypothetical protein DHS20C14_04420 [Phycisphaeraceae bacterium]|nr:MAG: hypothetical protein DHS20C14_04420 [Phycisphaeraceae bacterium]
MLALPKGARMYPEDPANTVQMIMANLVGMWPNFLVLIAGIVIACVFIVRHTRPAVFAIIALVGMLVVGIAGVIARELMMRRVYTGEVYFEEIEGVMAALRIGTGMLHAGFLGLLIAAVFVSRRSAPPPPAAYAHTGGTPPPPPRV